LKHDDWWIKNGGSIGSCGYAASKRSWQAALKHGTRSTDAQQLKAEIAALIAEIYAINPPRDFSREEVIGYLQRAATSAV